MINRKFVSIPRFFLGLIFVAGPVTIALRLVPQPELPARAMAFTGALVGTGYMLALLWSAEILGGMLLMSGFLVPFALVLLAPVIVNIVAFHVFLAPGGMPPAILVSSLELFLAWHYRESFQQLFQVSTAGRAGAFVSTPDSRVRHPAVTE